MITEDEFKIRCTTLDFDDKANKPKSLNPEILIINKSSCVIYQKKDEELESIQLSQANLDEMPEHVK